MVRPRWLAVVAGLLAACGGAGGDAPYDYAGSPGAARYAAQCQVCHGEAGEGGLGPALVDSPRSADELAARIAATMPSNAPGQCTGACATEIARFIKEGLTTRALRCDAVTPAPRRLRLLTRREYRATVRDLFGAAAPAMTCARATDCGYRDTCAAGACEATPCDAQTFAYDPRGRALASVHVAGDFNGWAGTLAGGGLPLALDAASGLWVGTFAVGEGHHAYKLVLNEAEWIADPRAPASAPDGFGGQNSVVDLSCAMAPGDPLADPAAKVPVETRPAGFPFDTDAEAALVTAAHVDAYLDAAEALAAYAAADPARLAPCDWAGSRAACGQALLADLGRRVFRRPLTPDELARYAALIAGGADAATGVQTALAAMLVSPAFLYRAELGEDDGHGRFALTQHERAAALSYAFLGTTPGPALLDAADRGELDAAGLEAWARRLVDDPRARAQLGEFALQWTGAGRVLATDKRADLFPDFTPAVRAALAAETRDFVTAVAYDEGGRFATLFDAAWTIVDPVAARFYGLPTSGKVAYADGRRAGLLGHAALLATTAHSDQTSPVLRGLLVRRNFLCEELPPPPPSGGMIPDLDPTATTRERFAAHSSAPACKGCHVHIDGIGFGLERFDPVGRWRETEQGKAIDATGDLGDVERLGAGTSAPFSTVPELATTIARSQAAPACYVRQYLRFTRGRRETLADRCGRRWVQERFDAAGGDLKELMVQSVLAPDFVVRR